MKAYQYIFRTRFFLNLFSHLSFCLASNAVPFADKPPVNESVQNLFAKKVNLDPAVRGKPLPTNDWWTTLLSQDDFPGRLYAYPFTVSADSQGIQIWYPLEWNENGTEMDSGEPLLIEPIDPTPDSDPVEKILFDFEKDWETLGWELEGTAFGDGPMTHSQHGSRGIVC
jgi:hypothetical protein